METRYIVCDGDGNVSYSVKNEAPESFKRFRGKNGAEQRAKALAGSEPGSTVRIYELTAEATAAVKPVEVKRLHSTERYK